MATNEDEFQDTLQQTLFPGDTINAVELSVHQDRTGKVVAHVFIFPDDLSPIQGGRVTLERTADSLTVHVFEVPEYAYTVGNTFSVTLRSEGTVVFRYGDLNIVDGLVGLTGGGGVTDLGETDLSEADSRPAAGTTYEHFDPGELDLEGRTLVFQGERP